MGKMCKSKKKKERNNGFATSEYFFQYCFFILVVLEKWLRGATDHFLLVYFGNFFSKHKKEFEEKRKESVIEKIKQNKSGVIN